ncbi:MAG: pectinesterase family protein [Christensenellaceae bacterium]
MKKNVLICLLAMMFVATLCISFGCNKNPNPDNPSDSSSVSDDNSQSSSGSASDTASDSNGNVSDITVPDGYELVTTKLDIDSLHATYGEAVKTTTVVEQGKFRFSAGVYFNASTGNITGKVVNNQKKDIFITLTGVENKNSIKFDVKGASSGDLKLYNSKGEVAHDYGTVSATQLGVVVGDLPADTYRLGSTGSLRFGNVSITEILEKSEPTGITVSGGATQLLAGRSFETTGLSVVLNYKNGRQDSFTSGYEIDSSKVNMNVAGKYSVGVSLKVEGVNEPFTTQYDVYVYAIDSFTVSDHSLNTQRVTLPVQKIFKVGEEFNNKNLAVVANCSTPEGDENAIPKIETETTFVLKDTEYTVSGVADVNTEGKKVVTVEVGTLKATYDVYYLSDTGVNKNEVVVDASATDVSLNAGVYTVKTVNQAVQTFKALGTPATEIKTIKVQAGDYKEKVEIDIPNVRLIGQGATASDTVLWHDTLAGEMDPSQTSSYSTDGSASVSIRETATNFYAENITFKNYYNTDALYQASKKLMSDTQAVAALVKADKSYFKNCNFTSYHDTLYAMSGRQVYEACYIEGRTDYIFGADATCYFTACTIKSIGSNLDKNGGYLVATKGAKGLLYGYIFDGCTLTGDDQVAPGTVALARGWESNMTVAYVNCNMSDKISLTPFGTKTDGKNDRYTNMNANPVHTQLFEYNNTGAGALSAETLATADANGLIDKLCIALNAEQAAQFTNKSVIFAKVQVRAGATNYTTQYADDWNGEPVA